jgi:hypothetical protein
VINILEDVIRASFGRKALSQQRNFILEFLRREDLVWESSEHQVKVIWQFSFCERGWFQQRVPDSHEVSSERVLKVGKGSNTKVIPNDEEKECPWLGTFLDLLPKQAEVYFEHGLEQAHVGTLVEADLVFPQIDDQNFWGSKGEERRFALKILWCC